MNVAAPFCHIVIPAPDLQRAKSFYESVFGWRVQESVPGPSYWFFASGNVGGAFDGHATAGSGSVVLILKVDDMPRTLENIAGNGGEVVRDRKSIGEASAGFDAYFLDPNGNTMGVFSDL